VPLPTEADFEADQKYLQQEQADDEVGLIDVHFSLALRK
jgi:hypothetical protein